MRILVTPERLQETARLFQQAQAEWQAQGTRLRTQLNGLDWEARQQVNVEGQVEQAARLANDLAQRSGELATSLESAASRFEQADSQSAAVLGASIGGAASAWLQGLSSLPPFLQLSGAGLSTWERLSAWLGAPLGGVVPLQISKGNALVGLSFLASLPWLGSSFRSLGETIWNWLHGLGWKDNEALVKQAPANPSIELNVFKPQSPLGEYKVTAKFPKYDDGTLHTGIDIQPKGYDKEKDINKNIPIHPVGPGKVFRVATEYEKNEKNEFVLDSNGNKIITGYGNYVVIEHTLPDGTTIYSRYAHMKAPSTLKIGDVVGDETELGNMGSTGKSTGPHLHFEIYKEGAHPNLNGKNPEELFNPKDPNSLTNSEQLKREYYDPEPFINGTTDIRFKKPTKE